ncbi:MAG: hypothetical protein OXP36_05315 [Gammaproteobacteria bacterium]|nr:hypothetical protein [Gammaproteobacteria bacterium]
MRAALAPVIGLFGVLAAFTAGAGVELGYEFIRPGQPGFSADQNAPNRYAAETLSTVNCFGGRNCLGYRIVASGQGLTLADGTQLSPVRTGAAQMLISTTVDTVLPSGLYYVRYDFNGAFFARNLAPADLEVFPHDGTNLATSGTAAFQVGDEGDTGDSSVIFELNETAARYGRNSELRLDLSGDEVEAGGTGNEDQAASPGFADIYVTRIGSITATVSVYDNIKDARAGNGAIYSATGTIAQIDRVTRGEIDSMADVADVSTSVEDGGPFRRFVPGGMGGKNSGVLGKSTTSVYKGAATWGRGYRNAMTGADVEDSIVASLSVTATSKAGNFAVATKNGGAIVASKRGEATNRNPWMMASTAECGDGALTLGVVGGTIETYQSAACPVGSAADCDGDPDGMPDPATGGGNLKASDLTAAGIASANIATGTAGKAAGMPAVGDNYFCVLVNGNTDPIPEIGDPQNPAEYNLTITPVLTNPDNHPFKPMAITEDVGAIDRNGTTVHLTYLTTDPFVVQRLVLVNRGADEVSFWIEDDSFNLEEGTKLKMNNLSIDDGQMIPGNGRLVVPLIGAVEFDGVNRGSATVNVAAPTRDIDVMTIQHSPATDEVDTTVYQHAGP